MVQLPINFQFLQTSKTSFNINTLTEKKCFCHGFSFSLMDYLRPPPPPLYNNQNPPQTKKFSANAPLAMAMKFQLFCKKVYFMIIYVH